MTVSQPSTGTVDTGSQAVFLPGAVLPVTGPHRTSSRVPGLKALGTKSVLAHARAHTHPPPLSCYSQVGSGAGGWPISSGLRTADLQSALEAGTLGHAAPGHRADATHSRSKKLSNLVGNQLSQGVG